MGGLSIFTRVVDTPRTLQSIPLGQPPGRVGLCLGQVGLCPWQCPAGRQADGRFVIRSQAVWMDITMPNPIPTASR